MQNASPSPAADDRSTQFVAVDGGEETTSAEALLVSAYAVMWVLLLLFVFFGWRRQRALESRLADIEKALDSATSPSET